MDPSVYDAILDAMDHRDSFSPLLSETGSISNLLLLRTLKIVPLRKLASLNTLLVDLTYIWHRFKICMTLSYSVKQTAITLKILEEVGEGGVRFLPPPPPPPTHTHTHTHTPTPLPMHNQVMSYFVPWITRMH